MKGTTTNRRKPAPIISDSVLAFSSGSQRSQVQPFAVPQHPPGVVPSGHGMAMDDALTSPMSWAASSVTSMFLGADHFIGYPELALLAQRPEYRRISETIATEMTRKWIRFQAVGDADKTDKIAKIEAAFKRFHIRDIFREVAEQDGFFGRGHIYVDLGTTDDPDELKTPIGDGRDKVSAAKVGKGSLKGFKTIEAVWCYPTSYNAQNPLNDDWYNPSSWFVMGKEIHKSRLLTFIGREVPDLLKPAYSFGGLSLSQIAMPTVESWLRTKRSVEELIHSFSVSGIKTNLTDQLNANPDSATGLHRRIQLFNNLRDNKGLMVLNSQAPIDGEEFFNVSTPLGTLDHLQAQAQEHICSVTGLPLIKYTGLTPSGLNASSDGEIRSFYDWIHSYQELLFSSELTTVLGFIQLNEFGSVDPDITFEYEPLWSLDEKSLSEKQKVEAETDQIHIATGVIAPSEARQRVAGDPDTPYAGLDIGKDPGAPDKKVEYGAKATTAVVEAFTAGLINHAQGLKELLESSKESGIFTTITPEDIKEAEAEPPPPSEMEMMQAQGGMPGGAGAPPMQPPEPMGGHVSLSEAPEEQKDRAADAALWEESKHRRGQPENAGQFGSGGGSKQNPKGALAQPKGGGETAVPSGKLTLLPKEEKLLTEYGEGNAFHINEYLKNPAEGKKKAKENFGPRADEYIKGLESDSKEIDQIINRSVLEADTKLYRGVKDFKYIEDKVASLKPGETFSFPTFSSTSKSKEWASDFNKSSPATGMIVINAKAGAKALDMEKFSRHKSDEQEMLLARNASFQFDSYDKSTKNVHVTLSGKPGQLGKDNILLATMGKDAEFNESDHPRDAEGRFAFAASQIAGAIQKHGGEGHYGLRIDEKDGPHAKINIGDDVPVSREWENGELTDSNVTGSSAIKLPKDINGIKSVLTKMKLSPGSPGYNYYLGELVHLIHSEESPLRGSDFGEGIFENATLVGRWHKKDSGPVPIEPNEE